MRVVTWNLDGLDHRHVEKRVERALSIAEAQSPDVLCLQEITERIQEKVLSQFFKTRGWTVVGPPAERFDHFVLLAFPPHVKVEEESLRIEKLPRSRQDRHVVCVNCRLPSGDRVCVSTAHFESLDEFPDVRLAALKFVLTLQEEVGSLPAPVPPAEERKLGEENSGNSGNGNRGNSSSSSARSMSGHGKTSRMTVPRVFAGDTNLRDKELRWFQFPADTRDAWTALVQLCAAEHTQRTADMCMACEYCMGAMRTVDSDTLSALLLQQRPPVEGMYTWDQITCHNHPPLSERVGPRRERYDRVYVSGCVSEKVGLCGLEEMEGIGMHPSDHYALVADISLEQEVGGGEVDRQVKAAAAGGGEARGQSRVGEGDESRLAVKKLFALDD